MCPAFVLCGGVCFSGGDADRVLQCIEEAHRLEGHVVDLLGDGSPKLPWKTYCSALDAIAKCCSVGRHRGTRPRYVMSR